MSDFTDPLNDPRFPDRPQTPDFWRLVDVGLRHDGESLEGRGPGVIIGEMVDEPSLIYYAKHRLGTAFGMRLHDLDPGTQTMILAIYLDAFAKGVDFTRAGGHRDK